MQIRVCTPSAAHSRTYWFNICVSILILNFIILRPQQMETSNRFFFLSIHSSGVRFNLNEEKNHILESFTRSLRDCAEIISKYHKNQHDT